MSVPSPAELFGRAPSRTSYMVFTVKNGAVSAGTEVRLRRLPAGGFSRQIVLGNPSQCKPVALTVYDTRIGEPCPCRMDGGVWTKMTEEYCRRCGTHLKNKLLIAPTWHQVLRAHPNDGHVPARLLAASLVETNGRPGLVAQESCNTSDKILVVFRTGLGRGGVNEHKGETLGWRCTSCSWYEYVPRPKVCPICQDKVKSINAAFPGKVIVSGDVSTRPKIVSTKMVALLGLGQVFQTVHLGEDGKFHSHYYMWDGEALLHATMRLRNKTNIF